MLLPTILQPNALGMPLTTDWSELEVAQVQGRSRLITCRNLQPLKILNPAAPASSCHAVLSSYGGGMVAGDTIRLAGYELLKAFPGLPTHDAAVEVPVFENDQDIERLQAKVEARWATAAAIPGYLIRGHGIYVWGADMPQALLRLEAVEFMLRCELEARRLRP